MSIFGLMNMGTSAMTAAQAQLQTTGHNIANASVAGYSRQSVALNTASPIYSGGGYIGRGVEVSTVTRVVNNYLTDQAVATGSVAAMDSKRASLLGQLEQAFGSGENGLGASTTQLFSAFSDLATNPGDSSARQVVLARAEDLAALTRSSSSQIEGLQQSVVDNTQASVAKVNELARQIATLNQQIVSSQAAAQAPNDLYDQRDQLVKELGTYVQVTRVDQHGDADLNAPTSVSLFVAGGQSLVQGSTASQLNVEPDEFGGAQVGLSISVAGHKIALDSDSLAGGQLAGLMKFQNQDLADARAQIGRLATSISTEVNRQQTLGLDLQGQAGQPLFSITAPKVVASASNQGPILPGVTLSNVRALQPSDYELSSDINGSFTLTRLSDGHQTQNLSDGAEVDGLTISLGSPPPEPGDRFLIQSVSQAAQQMSRVQDDPRALAAANPVTAAVVAGNTGTASIESLVIDAAPSQPYQALTLAFTDNAGNYEWRDGSGTALAGGQWQAGSPISYNGMELSLSGAPRSGDRIDLKPTTAYSASNGNALAMVSLGQRGVVDGASLADAYAAVLAGVGVRVQSANTAEQISTSVAAQAEQTLSSQTGVNLDEEAAKLIQFQQSYQAAAKVLQVAQKVFDTLLGIAN